MGLVVGIGNGDSIAWGCARAFHGAGAELALAWRSDPSQAQVAPPVDQVPGSIRMPLDTTEPSGLTALFDTIGRRWGRLDFVLYAIGLAPQADPTCTVADRSAESAAQALAVLCDPFVRMAQLAEPLMRRGGSLVAMSYLGGAGALAGHGFMGPAKAALESSVRSLATRLGPKGIRVSAVSTGPMALRAASAEGAWSDLAAASPERLPLRRLARPEDVGALCTFLASDSSRAITGDNMYVDSGFHILNE